MKIFYAKIFSWIHLVYDEEKWLNKTQFYNLIKSYFFNLSEKFVEKQKLLFLLLIR